jgi:DNA polymerase III gamma/tau subunit
MRNGSSKWRAGAVLLLLGAACQFQSAPPPAPTEKVVVVQGRAQASQASSTRASQEAEKARDEAEAARKGAEQAQKEAQETREELEEAQARVEEAQARAEQERTREAQEEARRAQEEAERTRAETLRSQQEAEQARAEAGAAQAAARRQAEEAQAARREAEQDARAAEAARQKAEAEAQAAREAQQKAEAQARADTASDTGGDKTASSAPAAASPAPVRTVTGQLVAAEDDAVTLRLPSNPALRLQVDVNTAVVLDGKRAAPDTLPEGSQVRASYKDEEGEVLAVRVEATSPPKASSSEASTPQK